MESSDPKDSNFDFSTNDLELISDSTFFAKKSAIMTHVQHVFATLEQQISDIQLLNLPIEVIDKQRGKISQGEKYLGAPWIVLDKPAYFSGNDIFAYRHMFLWGQSFTTSFHLSGQFMRMARGKSLKKLIGKDRYLLTGSNPFIHHYHEQFHRAIEDVDQALMEQLSYIRIAEFTNLNDHGTFLKKCARFIQDVDDFLDKN